jgi:hypothetical protein
MRTGIAVWALVSVVCAACGSSAPEPREPEVFAPPPVSQPKPAAAAEAEPATEEAKVEVPQPKFAPHGSVDDAINAVPQGSPRLNMSDESMQRPLMDPKQYQKCKVTRATRVSLRVAVYDGVAVGLDLTTKPKNAKMEKCLDDLVRAMTWEKVPSLNTVTFNF